MADKLPGLLDPKLPPDQQPLKDTSNPGYPPRPPMAIRPDRFTPGYGETPSAPSAPESNDGAPAATPTAPKKKAIPPKPTTSQPEQAPATQPQGENR
jgi:hypothetical protein